MEPVRASDTRRVLVFLGVIEVATALRCCTRRTSYEGEVTVNARDESRPLVLLRDDDNGEGGPLLLLFAVDDRRLEKLPVPLPLLLPFVGGC
jgi:hypothetical protein